MKEILPHLEFDDIVNLSLVDKEHNAFVRANLRDILSGMNYEITMDVSPDDRYKVAYGSISKLKNYVIAGGCALRHYLKATKNMDSQILSADAWETGDLDIFFIDISIDEYMRQVFDMFVKLPGRWSMNLYNKDKGRVNNTMGGSLYNNMSLNYKSYYMDDITLIRLKNELSGSIDCVYTRYKKYYDLLADFDLPFCAVSYEVRDGRYIFHPLANNVRRDIRRKKSMIYTSVRLSENPETVMDYIYDSFPHEANIKTNTEYIFLQRVQKYKERGFDTGILFGVKHPDDRTLQEKKASREEHIMLYSF